jgi:hypothetical protein
VLDAVARALRLDPAERAHLFDLARPKLGARPAARAVQRVRPGIHRLLESWTDQPAFVLGRRTDVLVVNRLARALLTDFYAMSARERNITRWIVLEPVAQQLYVDWERIAAEMVAKLRLDAGRWPDDPRTTDLVGELAMKSEQFRTWWADHRVMAHAHGTKRFRHSIAATWRSPTRRWRSPGRRTRPSSSTPPNPDRPPSRPSGCSPAGPHPARRTAPRTAPTPAAPKTPGTAGSAGRGDRRGRDLFRSAPDVPRSEILREVRRAGGIGDGSVRGSRALRGRARLAAARPVAGGGRRLDDPPSRRRGRACL